MRSITKENHKIMSDQPKDPYGFKTMSEMREEWEKKEKRLQDKVWIDDGYVVFSTFEGASTYEIPLSEASDEKQILRWVLHLSPKAWVEKDVLAAFIDLCLQHHKIHPYQY